MKKLSFFLLLLILGSGLRAEPPWKGVWISHETNQSNPNSWYMYRTTADVQDVPRQAIARIAADSKYWLWINGEPVVFEGSLKRGPAPGDSYYDEIDIAPFLKKGRT